MVRGWDGFITLVLSTYIRPKQVATERGALQSDRTSVDPGYLFLMNEACRANC